MREKTLDVITVKPDYSGEIIKIIRGSFSPKVIREKLEDYHEKDIAETLPELTETERKKLYRILDAMVLADVFEYTDEQEVIQYLSEMDLKKAAAILSGMEADAVVEVLKSMDRTRRELIIELMESEIKTNIARIASYDEDEIGSRMTTN